MKAHHFFGWNPHALSIDARVHYANVCLIKRSRMPLCRAPVLWGMQRPYAPRAGGQHTRSSAQVALSSSKRRSFAERTTRLSSSLSDESEPTRNLRTGDDGRSHELNGSEAAGGGSSRGGRDHAQCSHVGLLHDAMGTHLEAPRLPSPDASEDESDSDSDSSSVSSSSSSSSLLLPRSQNRDACMPS